MTEQNLTDLLERAAERTHVGAPPLEEMLARTRHRRRRRTALLTAAASAAAIVAVGGTAVLSGAGSDPQHPAGPADRSVSPAPTDSTSPSPSTGTATSLNGTWRVLALIGSNGQSVLPASYAHEVKLTLHDGKMTGTTGCNDVFGVYKQSGEDGQDLVFPRTPLGSTLVGCRDEPPLIARLLEVRHVSGSGNVRSLHADNWMIIAELRRR